MDAVIVLQITRGIQMTTFTNRRAAYEFAVEAACDAGILAQNECVASEADRHEPHGRFAAHKQAKDRVFPVAFYAHLAHLESFAKLN